MMALDFCFDRNTFLEQICRACSRYYSYDGGDEVEKMEFVRIFNDVSVEPQKPQLEIEEGIKSEHDSAYEGECEKPSEAIREVYQEMLIWNLNIKPRDGLPQQICKDCMERFRSVKMFREECLDTQKVLASYFNDFSLLANKSPKSECSIKIEPGASPAPSFNTDDLVEEVPESPEPAAGQSPMRSPKMMRHASPKFGDAPFYAESSMGTPPPLFEEIKTEPIDVQTMEILKTEAELSLDMKAKEEIKDESLNAKGFKDFHKSSLNKQSSSIAYSSSDDESSTSTIAEEEDDDDDDDDEELELFSGVSKVRVQASWQCKACSDSFATSAQLQEHQQRKHAAVENKPYACNLCPSTFKSSFMLAQHKLKHNRLDTIRCEQCGKFFRSQLHLQRHQKNFHLTSTYTCHICHEQFEKCTQIRFQYHVRQHGEKRFHCQYCDKSFHQKIHMINHERTHTKEQPFHCDICGKSYRQQTACQEHMLTHSDPKPFKCKICQKGFTQRSSLRLHYRLHTGNKPFRCELCGQNFAQKVHLEMHQLTHGSNACPFECEFCAQKFRTLHQLSAHIDVLHPEEATIGKIPKTGHSSICEHCDVAFATPQHLAAHIESVHMPEQQQRQYSCIYCGKTFAQASHLKAHTKTHTLQVYKTLQCDYCDKVFKTKQALELHEEQHEEEQRREQFKCSYCAQTFVYRNDLGKHMLSHLGTEADAPDDDDTDDLAMSYNFKI